MKGLDKPPTFDAMEEERAYAICGGNELGGAKLYKAEGLHGIVLVVEMPCQLAKFLGTFYTTAHLRIPAANATQSGRVHPPQFFRANESNRARKAPRPVLIRSVCEYL